MGISAKDMGEITQTWNGELNNWHATALDDENAYEIEDDDFSTARNNGRNQAEDKTGYDGKQGGQYVRTGLDGRLTLSVKKKIPEQMNDDASFIYETLQRENGFLPFNDKSDSEAVKNRFHMSKNAFKRAIGHLYKERLITIEKDGIHLN